MPEKEGYEVLRFVELGGNCYTSVDYVKGTTLYSWIKEHDEIEKETLEVWLEEILRQLSLFHSQQGNPDYQFLNPYNIIITKKNKVLLVSADEARKKTNSFVEKYFIPPSEMQNSDIYCFGKIIQFIMAHIQCEPYLSKKEEYKLLRIVKKCLEENPKNQYENIQEIQGSFIRQKKREYKIPQIQVNWKWGIIVVIVLIIALLVLGMSRKKEVKAVDIVENEIVNEKKIVDEYWDIGIRYFLELKDYEKSKECFQMSNQKIKAKYYEALTEFMLKSSSDQDVESALEALTVQTRQEKGTDIREILILIRVYAMLDKEEAYQTIIELGEELVSKKEWISIEENLQKEFYEYQALAYEQLQLWENAVDFYNSLYELEDGENEKEQIFLRLIEIYLKENETNKVIETCKKGMKELSKSLEIRVRYVESLWLDDNLDDNARLKEIQNIVSEKPELIKEESFIRLVRTKGIEIEGDKLWIKN